MNISLRLKDLQRMRDYLYPNEFNNMVNAIIAYSEDGTEFEFCRDIERVIWEDIKPMLDASKSSYYKWLGQIKKQNVNNNVHVEERQRVSGNYLAKIEDLDER